MTLPLYRIDFLIAPFIEWVVISMSSFAVLYSVSSFNSQWRRENFRRTFSFTTRALLTLPGLKPMGARDYLSVLARALMVIVRVHKVYHQVAVVGYKTGFFLHYTGKTITITITSGMRKRRGMLN